jgi:biopolymer transport protein ExbD
MAGGGNGRQTAGAGSVLQGYGLVRRGGAASALSEINVTPFVDVVLVLLIIFMITAPLMFRAIDVRLPAAGLRQDQLSERIVITLDREGRTYIDDRAVNIVLLEQRLREAVEMRGVRVAYLKADEDLRYKQIVAVIDIAKRAGVDNVGLAYVLPEEKERR